MPRAGFAHLGPQCRVTVSAKQLRGCQSGRADSGVMGLRMVGRTSPAPDRKFRHLLELNGLSLNDELNSGGMGSAHDLRKARTLVREMAERGDGALVNQSSSCGRSLEASRALGPVITATSDRGEGSGCSEAQSRRLQRGLPAAQGLAASTASDSAPASRPASSVELMARAYSRAISRLQMLTAKRRPPSRSSSARWARRHLR